MAGDWIKFEKSTFTKVEVIRLAKLLRQPKAAVIGNLLRVWCWADEQTKDGLIAGISARDLDSEVGVRGLAAAMIEVGWLTEDSAGLRIPNFDRHCSKSAKERGLSKNRMESMRSSCDAGGVTKKNNGYAQSVTTASPEKRREEKSNITPNLEQRVNGVESAALAADQVRVCKILGRKRAMLSYEAQQALVALSPIPEEEFKAVEWFYALPADPEVPALTYRRKDVDKLVINWPAELDRAMQHAKNLGISDFENSAKKNSGGGFPAGAKAWLTSMRQPEDTQFRLPAYWSELPGSLRSEWAALSEEQRAAYQIEEDGHGH